MEIIACLILAAAAIGLIYWIFFMFGLAGIWLYQNYIYPFYQLIENEFFLYCSGLCFALGFLILFFVKPHPGERIIVKYHKGRISSEQAANALTKTVYNIHSKFLPSAFISRIHTKRLSALNKKIKSETNLMRSFTENIRTKKEYEFWKSLDQNSRSKYII